VVGGGVFQHETLVTLDTLEDGRLLNSPLSNIGPVLLRVGVGLLGMGGSPSLLPVIGKLLDEGTLDGGRLEGQSG
jgi:hypothetical protein